MRILLTLLLAIMLAACGEDPVLPPAKPLAGGTDLSGLYAAGIGPHGIAEQRDLVLPATEFRREITLNLYYPEAGKGFPLLIFAHGNWSDRNSYDRVIQHWVSHGYAVIAPDFLDCCSMAGGIYNSLKHGNFGLIDSRINDINAVLDAMVEIEGMAPGFRGKGDMNRLAMTGHSFGAFTAQQFGGAMAYDEDRREYIDRFDERVKAIVALSPPGPMFDTITEDSWDELRTPTLSTTGTWDVQKGFWPEYRAHLMAHERAQPGKKVALVIEGADHYLGNLICRLELEGPPQHNALITVNSVSTAFLDAHLKKIPEARAYLASDSLQQLTDNWATLSRR